MRLLFHEWGTGISGLVLLQLFLLFFCFLILGTLIRLRNLELTQFWTIWIWFYQLFFVVFILSVLIVLCLIFSSFLLKKITISNLSQASFGVKGGQGVLLSNFIALNYHYPKLDFRNKRYIKGWIRQLFLCINIFYFTSQSHLSSE